jgi:hypothetical protein
MNNFYSAHPHYNYGWVSPGYTAACFDFYYFGPGFYAGPCWYPHWNPWVAWSWGYHCHPIWDPRPLWCRPVYYDPYVGEYVYWAPPVWAPLPEVSCGTWVDVKPVVVQPEQYDLQLLAVRFVDPGHPDEKLGPRYRVWFRNNSETAITKPFNVMLFAGNDNRLTDDLPRNGVRVTAIEAGDTQSVDIRLPFEVAAMSRDAEGKPAPFKTLQVLVDAKREVEDFDRTNNGAVIPRQEVLPVDPAAFEVDPVKAAPGGELLLAGEGLGPAPGQVIIHVAGKELQSEILGWYDLGVRVTVPPMILTEATPAEVIVVRGDGAATNPIAVTLEPGEPVTVITPPPPPPRNPTERTL